MFSVVLDSASMKRDSAKSISFPNHYRHDLLRKAAWEQRLSASEVSRLAKINPRTVGVVFEGKANNRKVKPVADVLGIDWTVLHNLDLSQVPLAEVATGKSNGRLRG